FCTRSYDYGYFDF
nr:immunoglobulin heavy chain junction region [Mus musculus]